MGHMIAFYGLAVAGAVAVLLWQLQHRRQLITAIAKRHPRSKSNNNLDTHIYLAQHRADSFFSAILPAAICG